MPIVTLSYKIRRHPVPEAQPKDKSFLFLFSKKKYFLHPQGPVSPCATLARPLATSIPYIVEPESPPYGARDC
jgi:hypothetical protein